MKLIKRAGRDIQKEAAHGGSGARKVLATAEFLKTINLDAMTHGFLPAGNSFDWHDHVDTEEVMYILKGDGQVFDENDEYAYTQGDVFIFPANTKHKITNNSEQEHEMIFVRIKV
jgi:mannose-6-phosphate isomerase-like protein (cupin superfamily)